LLDEGSVLVSARKQVMRKTITALEIDVGFTDLGAPVRRLHLACGRHMAERTQQKPDRRGKLPEHPCFVIAMRSGSSENVRQFKEMGEGIGTGWH
jgi:hypothetical protein